MPSKQSILSNSERKDFIDINQGDCVHIRNGEDLFQVIGVDSIHQKCWLRKWPLLAQGSPVFEISIQQVSPNH